MSVFPTPPAVVKPPPVKRTLLSFKVRLWLTWGVMLCLFAGLFMSFDLQFAIVAAKWQNLVGLHLSPQGFL